MSRMIALFFFILPFQFALRPVEGVDLAFVRVFAILVAVVWLSRALLQKTIILPPSWITTLFVSVLFLLGLSILSAENPAWGVRKYAFLLSFAPLFLILSDTFHKDSRAVLIVLRALVSGAAITAFIALMQFCSQFVFGVASVVEFWRSSVLPIFLGPTFGNAAANYSSLLVNIHGATVLRASAFFPDPHVASYFFGMTGACAIALAIHHRSLWWRIAATAIIFADLLTFSRGGYIALLALIALFILASIRKSLTPKQQKRLFTGMSTGFLLLATIVFFTPFGDRFRSSFAFDEGSNQGRIAMWQAGTKAALTHPFTGVGLGNFPLFVKPSADYREPIYAHNIYLDIAAEAGLLAGALFILLLASAFRSLWKYHRHTILIGPAAGIALFATHSLVENPLFSVHIFPILLLFLAIGATDDDAIRPTDTL